MIYPYLNVSSTISRPIIDIIIKSNDKFAIYPVLIDSGADYCIFSIDIAKALDIRLQLKDRVKFIGVGKEQITGFLNSIEIRIGNEFYKTKVIFADIHEFGYGILGQLGFFDHFDVKLSYQRRTIDLEPI